MPRLRANDPNTRDEISRWTGRLTELGLYHSIQLPDGRVLNGLQGIEQMQKRLAHFPVPDDLTGKRVLDIGAWDGWFSFEMERRGAQVVAFDVAEVPQFLQARELLASKVEYRIGDICRISPKELGCFDIVLFFGVLYHTKHPLLALENVCEMARDMAFVESFVIDDGPDANGQFTDAPRVEFYEHDQLGGRFDNWTGPNTPALLAMCRTAGFARVELGPVVDQRAHVTCWRRWPDASAEATQPAPVLSAVTNSLAKDNLFQTRNDEYVSIFYKSPETDLTRDTVFPEIGGFGTIPIYTGRTYADGWETVTKLPPGIGSGWQDVRLRTAHSVWSKPVRVGVDLPEQQDVIDVDALEAGPLEIRYVRDGKTWAHDQVRLDVETYVSIWVSGIPPLAGRPGVGVRVGEHECSVVFLSAPGEDGLRQINALLPPGVQPGNYGIVAVCGRSVSPPAPIAVKAAE